VLFLTQNPEQAIVDSLFHYIVLPVLLIAVGAATVFYAIRNGWHEFRYSRDRATGSSPPEDITRKRG
jgi:hypothetical protein